MASSMEAQKKRPRPEVYADPLVVPALGEHRQTFILLHGRGSHATKFGPPLLASAIPGFGSLPAAFPHAKFVFPNASRRRAACFNRSLIHQWFDHASLQTPSVREELQIPGLRETSLFLHGLLRREIALVGAENVVLGGLSQGCAAALIAMLLWHGDPIAAVFGMCGYLPFGKHLEAITRRSCEEGSNNGADLDDPFAHEDKAQPSPAEDAIRYLCDELDLPKPMRSMAFQKIPVFLGHGAEDEKVPMGLSREASSCLEALGVNARRKEYNNLGHWYSEAMLADVVRFLRELRDWHEFGP
ncbi:MAG: hypothetical protein Q9191_002872 [Dirinaria sp. TL-2023a]